MYVWALLNSEAEETEVGDEIGEDLDRYALILSIFRKMKLAEDKIDATKTEVSLLQFKDVMANKHFLTGMIFSSYRALVFFVTLVLRL